MDPREWVARARDLLGKSETTSLEAANEIDVLLDQEIEWRERDTDPPPEEERIRLLMEEERAALQELVCALVGSDPVSTVKDAPAAFVAMAVKIRAEITGRSAGEVLAAAHGKPMNPAGG